MFLRHKSFLRLLLLVYVELHFFEIKPSIKKLHFDYFLVINHGFHKNLEFWKNLELKNFEETSKSVKFRTKVTKKP